MPWTVVLPPVGRASEADQRAQGMGRIRFWPAPNWCHRLRAGHERHRVALAVAFGGRGDDILGVCGHDAELWLARNVRSTRYGWSPHADFCSDPAADGGDARSWGTSGRAPQQ